MEEIKKVIEDCKNKIDGQGKLIVRPSGTEPLIRVTAEGQNVTLLNEIINKIADEIENADD